jgi:hypothetical protein
VLSRFRRFDRPFAVEAVGKTNVNGVDVVGLEERIVASVGLRDSEVGGESVRSFSTSARDRANVAV